MGFLTQCCGVKTMPYATIGLMSCEFDAVDRWGVPLVCSHEVWDGHILLEHDYMEGQQDAVTAAVSDPYHVYRPRGRRNRRLYYRPFVLRRSYMQHYLLVVADYPTGRREFGRIVTAYHRQTIKRGDVLVWSRSGATA